MPLGIVSDSDYLKELGLNVPAPETKESVELPDTTEEVQVPEVVEDTRETSGRGKHNYEVPSGVRKLIGGSVIEEGRPAGLAIAEFLGISNSSVSAYTKGANSTASYNEPKKELTDFLHKTRKRISKKASAKLFKALEVIDEESLSKLSALEASTVAKNMSAIMGQMTPPPDNKNAININAPSMVFYIPKMASEDTFDVVHANE